MLSRDLHDLPAQAFVLVSNLGLAFIAHYNAPAFYTALTDASPARFGGAVGIAFTCLTLLCAISPDLPRSRRHAPHAVLCARIGSLRTPAASSAAS